MFILHPFRLNFKFLIICQCICPSILILGFGILFMWQFCLMARHSHNSTIFIIGIIGIVISVAFIIGAECFLIMRCIIPNYKELEIKTKWVKYKHYITGRDASEYYCKIKWTRLTMTNKYEYFMGYYCRTYDLPQQQDILHLVLSRNLRKMIIKSVSDLGSENDHIRGQYYHN